MSHRIPVGALPPSILNHVQIVDYFNEAGVTVMVYDYLLTFTREVSLIWPAPWTPIKVLFLLARYLAFVDLVVRIWLYGQKNQPSTTCTIVFKISLWLFYVGIVVPEVILTIRTWAVWNRDRRLTICLPIFFLLCHIPVIVIFQLWDRSLEFAVYVSPKGISDCMITKGSHLVFVAWVIMMIYKAGMFVLMFIKGYRCYTRNGTSQLLRVVFRDGILFYMYLFALALISVILLAKAPPTIALVLSVFERFIHPIVACRVILNLKEQAASMAHAHVSILPPNRGILPRPRISDADVDLHVLADDCIQLVVSWTSETILSQV